MRRGVLFITAGLMAGIMLLLFVDRYSTSQAAGDEGRSKKASVQRRSQPENFDALASVAPVPTANASQIEGGRAVQKETRFNVPTFLWASDPGAARTMRPSALERNADEIAAARGHLSRYAGHYRLTKNDAMTVRAISVHDTGSGAIIVKFKQDLGGVEVFRDELNIIMNRNLQLVAISGYLTGDNTADVSPASNFQLQPEAALAAALTDLTGRSVDPSGLRRAGISVGRSSLKNSSDPYLHFSTDSSGLSGFTFTEEPSRTRQMMFHLPSGYVSAYYVETSIHMPDPDSGVIDVSGTPGSDEWGYSYVISAIDGSVLFRKNQTAEQSYSYRVWADPTTHIPYDTPAGNAVHPKITAAPDGAQYPFLAEQDITLQSYPFSHNDPWLPAGATDTSGNNADAFVNLTTPDGYGPIAAAPYDGTTSTGDFRAQLTSPGQFLHTHVPDVTPASAEARQGSIQQLFYNVNFLHDFFYDAGFDEAAGNAQTDNYGRGGVANDNIKAQAQDFSARNNANMLTPADGGRPRMRMYIFDSNAPKYLDVLSPPAAAGKRAVGTGQFGQQVFDLTSQIVAANPIDGCTAGAFTGTSGKIVLVNRDNTATCSIGTKLNNAMAAGASAFVLVNLQSTPDTLVNVTGSLPTFTIPFVSITWNGAADIKTQLAVPTTVTVRLRRDTGIDRDGTIDNQVVFHEWGHYISNRLVGNSVGINTNMSGGMGEGWGDFNAMLALTVRPDDTNTASNATWNGAYALATYATSGGSNDGYYFGIRRVPYSTDLNIDPLTYRNIAEGQAITAGPPIAFGQSGVGNSEVHNTGEVWASMLWECYASLLRDTQGASPRLTFAQAQDRMKHYIVAAYKATPTSPTFLDARDAVLAAAFANDPIDGAHFAAAFAKRGAGSGAISPDRFSADNVGVVESFSVNSDVAIDSATVVDDVTSHDNDGYLDNGETGHVVVTLKNTGFVALSAPTVVVTADNAGVTFPSGNSSNVAQLQPFQMTTVSIPVSLSGQTGLQTPTFTIAAADPSITTGPTETLTVYANANDALNTSKTDDVEAKSAASTASSNPNSALNPAGAAWSRQAQIPFNYKWFGPDVGSGSDQYLNTPVATVDGSGSFNVQFDHTFGFEFDSGGNYDGGVVEMSVNGGAFADIGTSVYNGTLITYSGDVNPLAGRPAFVQTSGGTLHTSLTQAVAPGSTVQVRFRLGSDGGVGAAGWLIDNIALSGIVETPFATVVADNTVTAPFVSISGRVANASGSGIRGVVVTLSDGMGGSVSTRTSSFGYFAFGNVANGHTYTLTASDRLHTFAPQMLNVSGDISNISLLPN